MIEGAIVGANNEKSLGGDLPGNIFFGIQGPRGYTGDDGGYYTPSVKQTGNQTAIISFAPSKDNMPDVEDVNINLPIGEAAGCSVYYLADKVNYPVEGLGAFAVAVYMLSNGGLGIKTGDFIISTNGILCEVTRVSSSMAYYKPIFRLSEENDAKSIIDVTDAKVGQTVTIAAIDDNGVPTAWKAVDFPSIDSGGYVTYAETQELTDEQKAQARKNIGVDTYIEEVILGGEW